jgi:tetratricopeptide (TPR) repeat protein
MTSPSEGHRDEIRAKMADYLLGRLSESERHEVRRALEDDAELAAEFRFAQELEQKWSTSEELEAERMVELADGGAMTEEEERHFAQHALDRRALEMLREVGAMPRYESTEHQPRRAEAHAPRQSFRLSAGRWSAALVAVAAALVLMLGPWSDSKDVDLSRYAQIEVLPVRISRGSAEAGSFEEYRLQGLERYRDQQWSASIAVLDSALALRTDDAEVLLYRGSARLHRGEFEMARESFRRASAINASRGEIVSPLHEEILWQLAQCELSLGERKNATVLLQGLAAGRGARGARAIRQLESLDRGVAPDPDAPGRGAP